MSRPPTPSGEFQLAVECCRSAFVAGSGTRLADLARTVDWDRFVALVRFHRVQALVWDSLNRHRVVLPAPTAGALRSDAHEIAENNLRIAAEMARLQNRFAAAAIPMLFVKGLTLGALCYANPFLKMGWDIDVLVGEPDIAKAANLLHDAGYTQVIPRRGRAITAWHWHRKESQWRGRGGCVELHSRLSDNRRLLPRISVKSPSQNVEIVNGNSLKTLANDELFAYLCVHGASSAWFRVKWIADFAAFADHLGSADLPRLYHRSQELGAGRAAAQALLIANTVFGTDLGGLDDQLSTDSGNRWLADAALRQLSGEPREPTAGQLGTLRIHLTQFRLLPGVGFKLSELIRQGRDFLV